MEDFEGQAKEYEFHAGVHWKLADGPKEGSHMVWVLRERERRASPAFLQFILLNLYPTYLCAPHKAQDGLQLKIIQNTT